LRNEKKTNMTQRIKTFDKYLIESEDAVIQANRNKFLIELGKLIKKHINSLSNEDITNIMQNIDIEFIKKYS